MVKLSVIYGPPTDPAAFETYYTETHMPLAAKVQGLRRFELSKVVGTPDGSKPAVYRMADLYFDSPDHMKQVMATPEARASNCSAATVPMTAPLPGATIGATWTRRRPSVPGATPRLGDVTG